MIALRVIKSLAFNAYEPLRIILSEWVSGKKPDPSFQRFIAAHEAGHAIIASLHNVPPLGAIVYGEGNAIGAYGEVFLDPYDLSKRDARAHIAIFSAGAIATAIAGIMPPDEGLSYGACFDFELIDEIAKRNRFTEQEIRDIALEVCVCLSAFKTELLALTDALTTRRFVSAAEIRKMVVGA